MGKKIFYKFIFILAVLCCIFLPSGLILANEAKDKKEPVIINGDVVEYSSDEKEATAIGNVEINFGESKLTCQKITVNTQTKDCFAEGGARLEDKNGVIEGEKINYNFETKTGVIVGADFRSNPYFGHSRKVEKVSDAEFIAHDGYFTTCTLNHPHYRIASKRINFFPKNKVQTKEDIFYLGGAPLAYLPQFNRSFRDPLMHVQLEPGKRKEWGVYMLSAWRFNLNDNATGRIYADYRDKLGTAEGFGLNYKSKEFGKGDFKYYYTRERDSNQMPQGQRNRFERYLARWRHRWNMDERTNAVIEYYKIFDSKRKQLGNRYNFLKDYFFREYEKDAQPRSYMLLQHNFDYSTINMLVEKRTNSWYDRGYVEKLPEVKFSLPSYEIGESRFYFDNSTSTGNYNKKNSTSTFGGISTEDVHVNRLDTTNKFSLPFRLAIFQVQPFVSNRETVYSKDVDGKSISPRTIFYAGSDVSTKFYRLFDVKTNFLRLDINGLRHIITPTVSYTFNHEPTIGSSKLRQIDDVDSITRNNSATLELSNKLQTKRKGASVDVVDFRITSNYLFKPKTGVKRGSNLSDIVFKLTALPYDWVRFDGDATLNRSTSRSATGYNCFSDANYNISFDLAKERYFAIGQRYQRKGGNQVTSSINWRLNPKWRFAIYERYEMGHDPTLSRGLKEQEYTISRDLHCWSADVSYNVTRGQGVTIWLIFRLKAFPETEFNFNQTYNTPKSGSQSNK